MGIERGTRRAEVAGVLTVRVLYSSNSRGQGWSGAWTPVERLLLL
jgi:hypothetical protein